LVLIHALAEALDIVCARARLRHLGGRIALVLCGELGILRRGVGGGGRTTAEEAADGVADGGSYCDTTAIVLVEFLNRQCGAIAQCQPFYCCLASAAQSDGG
jgi:hypothetical protein